MSKAKAKPSPKEPKIPRIKHPRGKNRILVIAPHGVMGDDDYTDIIAEHLHEEFDCFAVINKGFSRPDEDKGETSDPAKSVLDLGRISDGELLRKLCVGTPDNKPPHDEDLLGWIDFFIHEIIGALGRPLLIHVHGIHNDSIEKVASITSYKNTPENLHALIGYGQRNPKEQETLTAEKKTVEQLIKNLAAEKINAVEAPVKRVKIKGKLRGYCGSEPDVLNQYLRKKSIKNAQSIQMEIRQSDFKDDPKTARKTADSIANAIHGPLEFLASAQIA
jgi:hypothetical protein